MGGWAGQGFAEGERVVRERLAAATTASITERHAALAAEAAAAAAAGEAVEAEAAAATVAKLKSRLVTIPSQHVLCEEERGGAVLCFRQHAKDDVTQCRGTVEAFERCARHVKEQHVAAAAAKELKATPAHE